MSEPSSSSPSTMAKRPEWMKLHLWQIQPVRDAMVIGLAVGLVWLGYRLSIVTVPMLLALALAYLFEPVVQRITHKRRVRRPFAALAIIVVVCVAFLGPLTVGVGFAATQGVQWGRETAGKVDLVVQSVRQPEDVALRDRVPGGGWRSIRDFLVRKQRRLGPLATPDDVLEPTPGEATQPAPDGSGTPSASASQLDRALSWAGQRLAENVEGIGQRVLEAGGGVVGGAVSVVGSVGQFFFGLFLTGFFFYFFCTGYGRLLHFWEGLIPERRRARVFRLVRRMDRVIAGFVRGRVTVCACMVVLYTGAYWFAGVPAPFVIGPITGLLTLVPYAGAVSAPIAMFLMWLDPGSSGYQHTWWWIVGAPLVVLAIAQGLDDWVLTPAIQGKATDMDVPTILFASIAGGALAGVYGLLLAIPVAACVKILVEELLLPRIKAWSRGEAPDLLPISR